MKEWMMWPFSIIGGFLLIVLLMTVYIGNDNYTCACGNCEFDCNSCQCIGSSSELCHRAGFNMTSECCNEKGNMDICYSELGYGRLRE
jgi:hypothetical protein